MKVLTTLCCILALGLLVSSGCTPEPTNKPVVDSGGKDHGHDHGTGANDHSGHTDGPKGGVMFTFGDSGIKGEVVPKYGDNLVTFYIYDADGKTERKIKADHLTASRKVGEVETFTIPAVSPSEGMASRFELVDEKFAVAMKSTGATLEVEIDGVKHSTQLEKDPHAH